MRLHIDDPAIEALVRETRLLTGESAVLAIEVALRERLDRLALERLEEVRRVVREMHDLIDEHACGQLVTYREFDEECWDADGLPA